MKTKLQNTLSKISKYLMQSTNLGNDKQRLGKVCDSELFTTGEGSGEVLEVDGEGGLDTAAADHNTLALHHSLQL